MINRYTRQEMGRIWEEQNKLSKWLEIEVLACEALAELGEIPRQAATNIKKKAAFDIDRMREIEEVTRHDVVAFVSVLSERVGEDSQYIHLGLTSSDILDTGFALLLKEATELIIKDLTKLLSVLKDKSYQYKDTIMIGRTHGAHSEPITFGLKLARWYDEMRRNLVRVERAKETVSYGKISGAVGSFAHVSPRVEEYVCQRLDLRPAPISSQIISRDRHAEYFTTLAVVASSLEQFAVEIRHLQRTEVLEAEEFFNKGQKGSSAMPHKRNPIASENLAGLSRLMRSYALASLENVPLWHERDISHSSVERVIAPDSTILLDYMLNRFTGIVEHLIVYPENMLKNLERTGGLIHSQGILLELARKGLKRDDAYQIVQKNAMECRGETGDFKKSVRADSEIMAHLSKEEIEKIFDLSYHTRYVNQIFDRVFKDN